MSQAALGKLLGISQAAVSARLTGATAFTLDELDTLAAFFGVDARDLMGSPVPRQEGSDTRQAA